MLTLVVARYNEDVSWLNLIHANVVIVDKSQVGNTGREAASYLWFIAKHYESLSGDYLFCQGDPFAHCPDFDYRVAMLGNAECGARSAEVQFGARAKCDWTGAPHHPDLPIEEIAGELGLSQLPPEIEFTVGAQFLRSGEEIRAAWERWDLLGLASPAESLRLANKYSQAPWVFERLWDYLIPTRNETKP